MINIDLSKALHPRFWDQLPAFLPGLFFEICIALANPPLVARLAKQAQLGPYPLLVVALVIALVVGNAFMFWVRSFQLIFYWGRAVARRLWCAFLQRLTRFKKPWLQQRAARSRWLAGALMRAFPGAHGDVKQAWARAAKQLLARRYGLDPPTVFREEEWAAWSAVLVTPRAEDFRGSLLLLTTHATGWAGLAAAYLAPALRARYFFVFAGFLVAVGIISDWLLVSWQLNDRAQALASLRRVLEAIPQSSPEKEEGKQQGAPAGGS